MEMFFKFFNSYFWLIAIAVTFINGFIYKIRSRPYIQKDPSLAPGYTTLIRGYIIYTSIPWIVMGLSIIIDAVPGIRYFFYPHSGNPFVLSWWITLWILYALGTYWILFNGGAAMLIKHPGFLRGHFSSPILVKLMWLVMLAGGIAASVIIFTQNLQLPSSLIEIQN